MKDSTRNRAKGKYREVKGTITEKAGKAIGNPELEAAGEDEKVAGKVQQAVGKAQHAIDKVEKSLDI